MRVGRRGYQTSKILGRRMTVEAEIVEWDPPRRVTWQTIQGGATVRSWVTVRPDGAGSMVSGGAEGELNGVIWRLPTPFAVRMMVSQGPHVPGQAQGRPREPHRTGSVILCLLDVDADDLDHRAWSERGEVEPR